MILLNDDCLNALKKMESNSVDSLVTDPPAGISFMNKEWDSDKGGRDGWIAWMTEVMRECHRVLKPGAHGLVWAIPRTSHWTATALENAGFEVRDVVTHLFGSGFPKSLDISKAIDKANGLNPKTEYEPNYKNNDYGKGMGGGKWNAKKDAPSTDSAKQWQGWGTALKPASEHWVLVRKPLGEKTVAANVLKHGTGGINIDASRIATNELTPRNNKVGENGWKNSSGGYIEPSPLGRFPANLVLSHSPNCQDDQCDIECAILQLDTQAEQEASRFFYCAKISTSERNAGLDDMPKVNAYIGDNRPSGNMSQRIHGKENRPSILKANHHPTVKPKKLMSYFCKMITPPKGIVLDPFMGSGSTGIAAKECGFKFVGIEREKDYFEIASKRINGS